MKPISVVLTLVSLGVLTLVFPAWPLFLPAVVAIGSAVFFYERRQVPAVVYVFAVVVCAVIAGLLGVSLGARWACSGAHPGYDVVATVEAPNDLAMTAIAYTLGSWGTIRTETLRAFTRQETDQALAKMG